MEQATFFPQSSRIVFQGQPVFQAVGGNVINNTYVRPARPSLANYEEERSAIRNPPCREIYLGDINARQESLSKILTIGTYRELKPTNPFRSRVKPITFRRRVQIAEIYPHRDRMFTAVSFEAEDANETQRMRKVSFEVSPCKQVDSDLQELLADNI
ncbi:hypothetical protein V5O48_009345 [Marasmius crinis-equi]|uniref:Uncharacterized protein n=1 Tax=Marasmius crinis-equi TaxID=585013 RepID=A0ABR3FBG6_9AGAR